MLKNSPHVHLWISHRKWLELWHNLQAEAGPSEKPTFTCAGGSLTTLYGPGQLRGSQPDWQKWGTSALLPQATGPPYKLNEQAATSCCCCCCFFPSFFSHLNYQGILTICKDNFVFQCKDGFLLHYLFIYAGRVYHVVKDGLELLILRPQPSKCQDYRCEPTCSAQRWS